MNARLFIDFKECELSKREIIALSYGVNRLTDIESRQGYYSNTFKLPKTATNLEIFGHPDSLTINDAKRWQRLTAWIEVDGVQVVYGFAQLSSVGKDLEVVVKGGNSDWIADIRDKEISDIDLSDLDHLVSLANVEANRFNDYTDHYVYPDIDYGLLQKMEGAVQYWFLYPAVFVKTLIDRIFTEANWTLTNELDTNQTYQELIIPFANDQIFHTAAWQLSKEFKAHISSHTILVAAGSTDWFVGLDNDSTSGYFDNDNQITLGAWQSGVNIAGYQPNGLYDQTFTAVIDFTVTNWINGTSSLNFAFANVGVLNEYVNYTHTDAQGNGTFQATISARLLTELDQTVIVASSYVGVTINGGYIENQVAETHYRGSEWEFGINMPTDFKQTDLVKYVMNAFCLIAVPNTNSRSLRLVGFDSIPTNPPVDWSEKVDLIEDPSIVPEYGSYLRSNILGYDNDSGDNFIKESKDLGEHTITNSNKPEGKRTIYKAPFSLCNRVLTMNETVEKAAIHLHDTNAGFEEVASNSLTITGVSNSGVITVTSGASNIDEATKITLLNLDGSQTWISQPVNGQTFTITSIEDDTTIHTGKSFTGTAATTGTAYTGIYSLYVNTNGTSNIDEGYELIFSGCNGNQTIGGVTINGQVVKVVRQLSDTTLSTDTLVSGSTPATSGKIFYIEDYYKYRKTTPRIGVHRVIENSDSTIDLVGAATVTDASEVYFTDITWSALTSAYWVTLQQIIQSPQMVKQLIRLSVSDINQLAHDRPVWIDKYGCLFYLSYIDQFKTNQVDSTDVELVKLP